MKTAKTLTVKQKLANELRKLKPHPVQTEIQIAQNWFIADSQERRKKELDEVKQHIRNKFAETISYLITYQGKSRQAAEQEAFKNAMNRIQSWNL